MSDQFVAEIRIFGFNFAPKGWAFCNGQLLPISQNTALFSLLGTMYGGDGKSTFGLPNLQGNVPMHVGQSQGPGLSTHDVGETGGSETVTLLTSEVPTHGHSLNADGIDAADTNVPSPNASYAQSTGGFLYQSTANATLAPQALPSYPGGNLPHNNLMPYLTLNFCIALQGVFPPRS
jgi:microcystin-dependent protein